MRTHLAHRFVAFSIAGLAACANPTAGKPKARVSPTAPNAAAPAHGESIDLSPQNARIAFVGAKVTKSHDGSFRSFSGRIEVAPGGASGRVTVQKL